MTDKLKELALAATPGPWTYYDDTDSTGRMEIVAIGKTVARIYRSVPAEDGPNAAYIAAASPDAVLALLKRAEDAEAELARLKDALEEISDHAPWGGSKDKYIAWLINTASKALASGAAPTSKTIDVKWHHDLAKKETDRG